MKGSKLGVCARPSSFTIPPSSFLSIRGGVPLSGTVAVSGAKNAALPMMAAALLTDEPLRLANVPQLTDVRTMARLLQRLGVRVCRDDDRLTLETIDTRPVRAPLRLVRQMRASFCVLGPLLARRGRAVVPLPGGCRIGDRPVDLHLKGLRALGADIRLRHGAIVARAERLRGATIDLAGPAGPTVTGTANVLCAAVLAEGETLVRGAAREPEIVDLGRMLTAMGAQISGLGADTIQIEGVARLHGAEHTIIPDRIEAATLLLAAAITGGDVTLTRAAPGDMLAVLESLRAAGCRIKADDDCIRLAAPRRPLPVSLSAEPFPGVPTDVQAQWTALMALADGGSQVADRVFPARFQQAAELRRLGARIHVNNGAAHINGVPALSGAALVASDLRASAALVLAGLAAHGETTIAAAHHLDRGYERLDAKLRHLGARITRRDSPPTIVTA